jgi:hypothetical protein
MKRWTPILDTAVFLGIVEPAKPSPLKIAVEELEQAQRDSITAEAKAEEATAHAAMLIGRVDRLHNLVQELNHSHENQCKFLTGA